MGAKQHDRIIMGPSYFDNTAFYDQLAAIGGSALLNVLSGVETTTQERWTALHDPRDHELVVLRAEKACLEAQLAQREEQLEAANKSLEAANRSNVRLGDEVIQLDARVHAAEAEVRRRDDRAEQDFRAKLATLGWPEEP